VVSQHTLHRHSTQTDTEVYTLHRHSTQTDTEVYTVHRLRCASAHCVWHKQAFLTHECLQPVSAGWCDTVSVTHYTDSDVRLHTVCGTTHCIVLCLCTVSTMYAQHTATSVYCVYNVCATHCNVCVLLRLLCHTQRILCSIQTPSLCVAPKSTTYTPTNIYKVCLHTVYRLSLSCRTQRVLCRCLWVYTL